MLRVYYHQGANVACMQTHDLLMGMNQLGVEIHSNYCNYPFIIPNASSLSDYDIVFVSTSGGEDTMFYPDRPFVFVDGRDTDQINRVQLSRASYYFKTNSIDPDIIQLPTCVDPAWLTEPSIDRSINLSFFTGHEGIGRDVVKQWIDKLGGNTTPVFEGGRALNPNYPADSCNVYSRRYYQALADSLISVNAPGGGVNTKKFFEIIASGCVCLNYVPVKYHQETANILDIIPEELQFPRQAVINFSDYEDLANILENVPVSYATLTYEWAKNWTYKDKAAYVLKKVM